MYQLESALQDEEGMIAVELKPGDLAVILSPFEFRDHIVLKVGGDPRKDSFLVDLTIPGQSPWEIHCNFRVRKLSAGESITLTV